MPDAAIGPNRVKDLVLPSWIVHVYRANGMVFFISITDLEDVYEYPIHEDSRPATHGDLNYMILATQPFMVVQNSIPSPKLLIQNIRRGERDQGLADKDLKLHSVTHAPNL
ncbi:hypothetical protein FCV25MIE_07569 [Fagus crenata]